MVIFRPKKTDFSGDQRQLVYFCMCLAGDNPAQSTGVGEIFWKQSAVSLQVTLEQSITSLTPGHSPTVAVNSDGHRQVDGLTLPSTIAAVMGRPLERRPATPKKKRWCSGCSSDLARKYGWTRGGTPRVNPRAKIEGTIDGCFHLHSVATGMAPHQPRIRSSTERLRLAWCKGLVLIWLGAVEV